MSSLSQVKILGGLGSIVVVLGMLGIVPFIDQLVSIIGYILVLIAVKIISDSARDASIFKNMLLAIVAVTAGMLAGALYVYESVFNFIGVDLLSEENFFQGIISQPEVQPGDFFGLITSVIIGLVILWILIIISAIFMRKSYNSIIAKYGISMFNTAARLYLIGAVLSIILIGFILVAVVQILQIVAFFRIPDRVPQS
jgi:uncharacterized membrane protein